MLSVNTFVPGGREGGGVHMKLTEILVVSLRGGEGGVQVIEFGLA